MFWIVSEQPDGSIFFGQMRMLAHSFHQPGRMPIHSFRRQMHSLTVAGQDPFKPMVEELCHRCPLLGPRVPAVIAKRGQALLVAVPSQMVSGKEILIVEK